MKQTFNRMCKPVFILLSISLFLSSCSGHTSLINVDSNGVAIKGYDPVAYFTNGGPKEGKEIYSHDWQGARWLFASSENRDLFIANPDKYIPKYGGY